MTELHHFHPARKRSGSLRPFPIYPLYTQTVILSLDKPIADCFLFCPRKSCERRRKCSHTNVSNTLVTRPSTPPVQTPQCSFQRGLAGTHATPAPNRAHSGSQGETRGVSGGGGITTLGAFRTFQNPCVAGCQNGVLCRFWVLVGVYSRRTQRAFGTAMRLCASLFRGVAAPLGCVIPLLFLSPH